MSKPILGLDFDGVIHSYTSGWKSADIAEDPPVSGTAAWILEATRHFIVAVYSSRSHQDGGIACMRNYMEKMFVDYGLDEVLVKALTQDRIETLLKSTSFHSRDTESKVTPSVIQFPRFKPSALVTLDDRALTFTGTWPAVGELLAFEPWNKRDASLDVITRELSGDDRKLFESLPRNGSLERIERAAAVGDAVASQSDIRSEPGKLE